MNKFLKMIGLGLTFLTYKWLVILVQLVRRLCRLVKKRLRDKREKTHRERRETKANCVPINSPVYYKPDPLIYAQHYLMKLGFAVTWDNPDIQLFKAGVPVSSHAVLPDTEYDIVARIWNASHEAPVVGMPVRFSYLDFGAGTAGNPIGQTMVNVGIIGGSNNPTTAKVVWRTPTTIGHYCIQVKLEWADDKNLDNNLGQENINVVEAQSPAFFDFKVRNDDKKEHRYRMEVDTYYLREPQKCRDEKETNRQRRRADALNRHNRADFPIPAGWSVVFDTNSFGLAPGAERQVKVTITPPDTFVGKKPFNVHVFDERNVMTGGVTVYIEKK